MQVKLFCIMLPLFYCIYATDWNSIQHTRDKDPLNFRWLGKAENSEINYYISTYKANQSKAAVDCRDKYFGRMLTIYNQDQDTFVERRIYAAELDGDNILTSGTKNLEEPHDWEWLSTTEKIIWFKWYDGEPSGQGQCITVTGTRETWGWRARSCDEENLFICEFFL